MKRKPKLTTAQILLRDHLLELGITTLVEFQFCEGRKFRFDLYSPELRMGFEASGGRWKKGHRSSRDIEQAYEKMNLAQLLGFRVLEFSNEQIMDGRARAFLLAYL